MPEERIMSSLSLANRWRGSLCSRSLLVTAIFFGLSVAAFGDTINTINSGIDPFITYSSQYLGAGYVFDPQQNSGNQSGNGPAFTHDSDQQYFAFSIATPDNSPTFVFMYTSGFAYGDFAPVLSLYQDVAATGTPNASNYLIMADNTGGPPCNLPTSPYPAATPGAYNRGIDPTTGFCWDADVSRSLAPGNYLLVLTEYGNTAQGPTLADGFAMQGQGNFTGAPGTGCGDGGSFELYNYDCSVRNGQGGVGNWITTIDTVYTPEPEPGVLLLIGTLLIFGSRRAINSVRNRQEK